MSQVILITWGASTWTEQGRLIGRTDLPLTEAGRDAINHLSEALDAAPPDYIRSGPEEAAHETARLIARRFHLRPGRMVKDLAEVNLGLWSGLTEAEIEQRFTRAHEQWRENPETICPPEGESVGEAAARLNRAAHRLLKKHDTGRVAMVVGPMAASILNCEFRGEPLENFWRYFDEAEPLRRIARGAPAPGEPDSPGPPQDDASSAK